VLCNPLSPIRRYGFGSPRVRKNVSAATGIDRLKALPDQRLHSLQWQAWTNSGHAITSKRTASHGHPPVSGRAGIFFGIIAQLLDVCDGRRVARQRR
jgi:hypothetical protein